jgi:hypothetical protein
MRAVNLTRRGHTTHEKDICFETRPDLEWKLKQRKGGQQKAGNKKVIPAHRTEEDRKKRRDATRSNILHVLSLSLRA